MKISATPIQDLFIIEPTVHGDDRGYFFEAYREEIFKQVGLPTDFKQENQAKSSKGILRGLHYQLNYPQGKLVRVSSGTVYDVAVDIRKNSPTFGKHFGLELSAENFKMLFIPVGFAHGYAVLSETAIFQYKTTDIYHPEDEFGLKWDDPALGIKWQVEKPILSEKDKLLPMLDQIPANQLPI